MSHYHRWGIVKFCVVIGSLAMLASFGGTWGRAYGQSAGPPPEIEVGPDGGAGAEGVPVPPSIVSPAAGAEGAPVPSSIVSPAADAASPDIRNQVVAGESGTLTQSSLPGAGAVSTLQWSLLLTGLLLCGIGLVLLVRIRRAT